MVGKEGAESILTGFIDRYFAILLVLMSFVLYSPGMTIPYYGDDFKFVFEKPSEQILDFFYQANPNATWYRPIEAAFLCAVQTLAGWNTTPIHVTQVLLHGLLSCLIFASVRLLGFSRICAVIGSLFFLVSQSNCQAVLSNDTFSQVTSTIFGCLAVWFLLARVSKQDRGAELGIGVIVPSLILFSLSLLSKETGVAFLVCVGIVLLYHRFGSPRLSMKRVVVLLVPFVVVTCSYLLLRSVVVSATPASRYDLEVGANIFKNLGMLFFASITPTSTVKIFQAFAESNVQFIVATTLLTTFLVIVILYGLRHSRTRGLIALLATLGLGSVLPMIFMMHVSELYTYNTLPFVTILAGIGIGKLYEGAQPTGATRKILLTAFVFVIFFLHGVSITEKAKLMNKNGDLATDLLSQIVRFTPLVPSGGTLFLVNKSSLQTEYSVFLQHDFSVFRYGENIINQRSGRDDFHVIILDWVEWNRIHWPGKKSVLSINGGVVYQMTDQWGTWE